MVSFDLSLEIIALVYAKLVSATRKKLILSGENSAGKVITHVHFHCVLQTMQKWIFTGLVYANNYYPELFYTGNIVVQ